MNIATVRLGKEMRALIGTWSLLAAIGLIAFAHPFRHDFGFSWDLLLLARLAGFWVGLPLLATLSIGHEFQNRTAPLLLAQPVLRSQIWQEKWIVLLPGTAIAVLLYLSTSVGLSLPVDAFRLNAPARVLALVWVIVALCTAPFWTLVGRSTLNGLVLNLIQGFVMFQLWQWLDSVLNPVHLFDAEVLFLGVTVALVYAAVMFWLGHREFVRFEVDKRSDSADMLFAALKGTNRFAGLLRGRSGQPLLNLLRKEIRLQWITWFLLLTGVLGVLCLGSLHFAPGYSINRVGLLVASFVLAVSPLCAILAGSLSVGEERTLGTNSWHRTLPVSGAKQWFVKVSVVLLASSAAAVLPVSVAKVIVGQNLAVPFGSEFRDHNVVSLVVLSALLSFSAFWCACLVKGTIRAALLTLPAIAIVVVAIRLSVISVQRLHFTHTLDPFILKFHPFPFTAELNIGYFFSREIMNWLIAPPLLLAVIQSYRLFGREVHERFFAVVRPLLEVALTALVVGTMLGIPSAIMTRASQLSFYALMEANDAIGRLPPAVIPEGAGPTQLSVDDLSSAGSLSDSSRELLRETSISVNGKPGRRSVSVRFRNGLSCSAPLFVCKRLSPK
jgi:hypothetical protein